MKQFPACLICAGSNAGKFQKCPVEIGGIVEAAGHRNVQHRHFFLPEQAFGLINALCRNIIPQLYAEALMKQLGMIIDDETVGDIAPRA